MTRSIFWWSVLILSCFVLVGCVATPAQAAGIGAAGVAAFDAMLQSLTQSGQIDPAQAAVLSGSVHGVADNAAKTAEGLSGLMQAFSDFKTRTAETFAAGRELMLQQVAAANESATMKAGVAAAAGGAGGVATTQVVRGPSHKARQAVAAKASS